MSASNYDLRNANMTGTLVEGDIQFYIQQAEEVGEPVLELAVGTGRVATEIAKAGHKVVGIDLSEKMLHL